MKRLTLIVFLTLSFTLDGNSQTSEIQKLNLDFEQNEKEFPAHWEHFGNTDYLIFTDSTAAMSGKFSAVIENKDAKSDFRALAVNLPHNYNGKFIRFSGYIKTENVTEGYAGLWLRIDPEVAFDNMSDRGITGTTDWNKYEIILPLNPRQTDKIVIGGLLVGKGKMWLDDLQVSIDGKDLDSPDLEIYEREILPAEKDQEFDQGSNIAFPTMNEGILNNLDLLGKIWGFLKYHHPEIAKGNYNWDYELFRMLPAYLKVTSNKERDNLLTSWIGSYGSILPCTTCKPTPDNAVLKPDLSWIETSDQSTHLKSTLNNVYDNRHQGKHYYISLHENIGNPEFTNENPYEGMSFPDEGFRLLSLYRYWNMIQYFFPNKHLTDQKWESVLKEYLPKFINAKDELEYELAAVQLIGEVNDTHANLWGGGDHIHQWRGNNFTPFKAEFVENKYVITDYYNPEYIEDTGLKIGDCISHINGKTVEAIVDSLKPYYPSSNEAAMLRDISADLLRSTENTVHLNFISDGKVNEKEVTLYDGKDLNSYQWYKVKQGQKSFRLLEGNIGYVTLANIEEKDIPQIKESFKNTRGIIIDIRNYPSTFVPFALGSYFVSEPTSFVKFTMGNPDNPGEFTFREGAKIQSDNNLYKGKLVVLVNENSQSQAEYTAMAFRAVKNSMIVGSTTAGADGNVSTIFLPGGLRTMISGIGVYYPDGTETQRIGITPDIIVKPTIEGIKEGKDEVLEKAIQILNR